MSLKKVANQIEQLRGRYEPTSDEAVLLGIFRDMAVFASRKSWPKVKTLALSIEDELMDDAELSASVAEELVKVARELVAGPAKNALQKEWNALHDVEDMLEDAASIYEIAASYSGKPGESDARRMAAQIEDLNNALKKLSMKMFGRLVDEERKFERKHGDVRAYIKRVRNEMFPV